MYKLLIADDEPLIRRGIKNLVDVKSLKISEVIEAEDGEETIELAKIHKPDIILMDINMPKLDGLTAAKIIKDLNPRTYLVILTGYDYFEYTQNAIRARVDDYILKPVSKKDIEYILKTALEKISHLKKIETIRQITSDEEVEISFENQHIKEYIEEHIFDPSLSLSKMADDLRYNRNYLSILVKQIYSLSFQEYINKRRMEQAKLLLLSTDLKNYDIAERVGIEDVNYFVNKFKKFYNITPKNFKNGN